MEPWFGGKRPNHFSINAYFSRYTGLNESYYSQNTYYNPYMYGYGGYPYYGGGTEVMVEAMEAMEAMVTRI